MDKIKGSVLWIMANTGIDEMVLEAIRAFIATSIAVALGQRRLDGTRRRETAEQSREPAGLLGGRNGWSGLCKRGFN